jgi:hypothetical protein
LWIKLIDEIRSVLTSEILSAVKHSKGEDRGSKNHWQKHAHDAFCGNKNLIVVTGICPSFYPKILNHKNNSNL